jgi:hypothetical protein
MKKRNSMEQQQPTKPRQSVVHSSPKWMFWWFCASGFVCGDDEQRIAVLVESTAPMSPPQLCGLVLSSLPSLSLSLGFYLQNGLDR